MHQLKSIRSQQPLPLVRSDEQSADLIDHLVDFAASMSGAHSAVFFWVGQNCEIVAPRCLNVPEEILGSYDTYFAQRDPLHISRLWEQKRQLAVLSHLQRDTPGALDSQYKAHLASIQVGDEVDLVFWRGETPFACLALMRSPQQQAFTLDAFDWQSLRNFVQSSLSLHWRVRAMNVEEYLTRQCGLKPRELEVVRYVLLGKSNCEIAEILGITVPTVKSHIISILDKTGVSSRLGIACFVHGLEISSTRSGTGRAA